MKFRFPNIKPLRTRLFEIKNQALEDARADAEDAKSDLLTADQDLANKPGEADYWKMRAEVAEKDKLPRDKSEKRRGCSFVRSDDDHEDAFSFSDMASHGLM